MQHKNFIHGSFVSSLHRTFKRGPLVRGATEIQKTEDYSGPVDEVALYSFCSVVLQATEKGPLQRTKSKTIRIER